MVCGAAVLFRALRTISLRRCAALNDEALTRLMRSSCPQLEARCFPKWAPIAFLLFDWGTYPSVL